MHLSIEQAVSEPLVIGIFYFEMRIAGGRRGVMLMLMLMVMVWMVAVVNLGIVFFFFVGSRGNNIIDAHQFVVEK